MKLALYQGPSPAGDLEQAFVTVQSMLAAASCAGAAMLVFPELYLPGYNQGKLHRELAQTLDGPWVQRLCALCESHHCGLTIGLALKEDQSVYNSAIAIDISGTVIGVHHKLQLFGEKEAALFMAGSQYVSFDVGKLHVGLLICYDVEFAHHVRQLAERGVQLLLVPTANMQPFDLVSDTLVPARAAETNITIAYANYCGSELDLTYCGGSVVVGRDARPLAKAGNGETLLIVDLDSLNDIDKALRSEQLEQARTL